MTPVVLPSGPHVRVSRDPAVHVPEPFPARPAPWRTAIQTIKRIGIAIVAAVGAFLLGNFGLVGLIVLVITVLLTVIATVIGSSAPAALIPFRVVSEQMPSHGGWRTLALTAMLIGGGAGMVRHGASQQCSDQLAAAEALQRASDVGAARAFAEARKTCASVGREGEVSLAMQAASVR